MIDVKVRIGRRIGSVIKKHHTRKIPLDFFSLQMKRVGVFSIQMMRVPLGLLGSPA